ncbi:MAG: phosphate acyltransferase PlsX [Gammaproteobacteria bacterium]|nr:phosphate acyltransferase PlsX [Gammaproteobacteria bacterium]NNJ92331.1 phosphate acyltransferase PlsX [Gammaproteobacteria bacterium]
MAEKIRIALDAMGGDNGVKIVVAAALDYLSKDASVSLVLCGDEESIKSHLPGKTPDGISIVHATQEVAMDELPSKALRNKKDSSMRVAINQVKEGHADACVSAGNTGALMATARFVLKMIPGIERPAIITQLPGLVNDTWVLDLGANVDCTSDHLFQFAVMGSELLIATGERKTPKVGLLNIGQEEIKGNEQVKKANELLSASELNYIGYVEGDDIYTGDVDIVVTDGFIGNVALKSSEGVAKMIRQRLKAAFTRSLLSKLAGVIAYPVLKTFAKTIDPRRYNGASLLGLKGIVVKSHGGVDALAFENAIAVAKTEVQSAVTEHIQEKISLHMNNGKAD